MWPNPQGTADLVTFTGEILNWKRHFLCRVLCYLEYLPWSTENIIAYDQILKILRYYYNGKYIIEYIFWISGWLILDFGIYTPTYFSISSIDTYLVTVVNEDTNLLFSMLKNHQKSTEIISHWFQFDMSVNNSN